MKKILTILVLLATSLANSRTQAQSLAYEKPEDAPQITIYTPAAFSHYQGYGDGFPPLVKVGTVMSGAGIIAGVVGGVIFLNAAANGTDNAGPYVTGAVMFVAGGVIGITGGCLSMAGLMQMHHRRYGFQLVTPKNNQVGIAYNF